jgi:plasmid rolling circle replication initiator protein Rep
MCAWRVSLKTFANMSRILAAMATGKTYAYLHLRLSAKRVQAGELAGRIDDLLKGWDRFMKSKAIATPVKGWFRALEVTHDPQLTIQPWMYKKAKAYYKARGLKVGDLNPQYDTYNPHFHVLIAVNPSYFKSADYLSQAAMTELWRRSMRLDYDPVIHVERVKGNTAKAVAELSKYSVKDADYIVPEDWDLTVDAVRTLDAALERRRLVAYGGVMREWHHKLHLSDEGADVHIGDEGAASDAGDNVLTFRWNVGFNQYFRE